MGRVKGSRADRFKGCWIDMVESVQLIYKCPCWSPLTVWWAAWRWQNRGFQRSNTWYKYVHFLPFRCLKMYWLRKYPTEVHRHQYLSSRKPAFFRISKKFVRTKILTKRRTVQKNDRFVTGLMNINLQMVHIIKCGVWSLNESSNRELHLRNLFNIVRARPRSFNEMETEITRWRSKNVPFLMPLETNGVRTRRREEEIVCSRIRTSFVQTM